jgi:hypothetical protein
MGEEQIQQPKKEDQVQGEEVREDSKEEEGPVVKVLRQKLEQEIRARKQEEEKRKQLEEELAKARELLNVSDIGSLMQKVERLELENIVAKKYPELSDEIENILQFRRAGETIEDTILRYIGKKTIENRPSQIGFSLGSNKLTSAPSEPKGEALTKEQAEQLFKQLYYPEE